LIGKPDHASLDLAALHQRGVRLVGRVRDINGHRVSLADDLVATTAAADIKMADILTRIDQFIAASGAAATSSEPFDPTWPLAADAPDTLNLKDERVNTVIWATGYRRAYPWLRVPVMNARGDIMHNGGITPEVGLYVLGMNFQRRRSSSFIDGVGADAWVIAQEIARSVTHVPLSPSVSVSSGFAHFA
jgi:putative flavoprotein involved in K+ transport